MDSSDIMKLVDFQKLNEDWDGRTVFEVFSIHGKTEYSQGLFGSYELAVRSLALSPMLGGVGGRGISQTPSNSTKFKIVERRVIED